MWPELKDKVAALKICNAYFCDLKEKFAALCHLKDNVAVFQASSGRRTEPMIEADLRELSSFIISILSRHFDHVFNTIFP